MGGVCCSAKTSAELVPKGKVGQRKKSLKKKEKTPDMIEQSACELPLDSQAKLADGEEEVANELRETKNLENEDSHEEDLAGLLQQDKKRQLTIKCSSEEKLTILQEAPARSLTIPSAAGNGMKKDNSPIQSTMNSPATKESLTAEPELPEETKQESQPKLEPIYQEETKQEPLSTKEDPFSFDFDGDSDEEIVELEKRRSKWDEGVIFTKRKLIEHIDKMLAEADVTKPGWKEKIMKKNELTVHLKNGSYIAPGKFLIRGVTYFNKSYKIERVVKSLYDAKQRRQWDKKQMEKLVSMQTPHPNVRCSFFRYKKFLVLDPKEYSDKMIQFKHNNCIYSYSTTNGLRDQETGHLKHTGKGKTDQCDSIIAISKYSVDPVTEKIVAQNLAQSDSKLEIIPDFLMAWQLPKALELYIQEWKKYVLKEHNGKLAQD